MILYEWLKTEALTIRKIGESRDVTATRAAQALGFPVTQTHVTRCSETIPELKPWPHTSGRPNKPRENGNAIRALALEIIALSVAQGRTAPDKIFKLAGVSKFAFNKNQASVTTENANVEGATVGAATAGVRA